ncbi:MAG: cytochrome C oxidase subunit IV family protein [Dehalococcoidia bacterium]|jgi:cytochrome c oxidase subunit IV|nr:cytochrome C oxidase subunit IV family protein [Dehalococcoidia bacterium]|tara:strand:+ start:47 stop:310 length:264 start_codon:yes stop_codon:yes gene_type:complete
MHQAISDSLKTGWIVIGVLAILTAVEFLVAVIFDNTAILFTLLLVMGLLKAWLIIQYFMHFGQLWKHVTDAWNGMLIEDPEADREED